MSNTVPRAEERRWQRTKPLRHGVLLRAAREQLGWPMKHVCALTHISMSQLSEIERGIGTPMLQQSPRAVLAQPIRYAEGVHTFPVRILSLFIGCIYEIECVRLIW